LITRLFTASVPWKGSQPRELVSPLGSFTLKGIRALVFGEIFLHVFIFHTFSEKVWEKHPLNIIAYSEQFISENNKLLLLVFSYVEA